MLSKIVDRFALSYADVVPSIYSVEYAVRGVSVAFAKSGKCGRYGSVPYATSALSGMISKAIGVINRILP